MIASIIGTLLILLISSVALWYLYMGLQVKRLKGVFKGDLGLPFLGYALVGRDKTTSLEWVVNRSRKYGTLAIVPLGPTVHLLITDPAIIAEISNSIDFNQKDKLYTMFHLWLGTGLLTSYGNKWAMRRKTITPTFHFKILTGFIDTFESVADILITKLKNHVGKAYFNIYPLICLYTMDTICETAMGISINAQIDSNSKYIVAIQELLDLIGRRSVSILNRFDFIYRLTSEYRNEVKLTNYIHEHTEEVIRTRRRNMIIRMNQDVDDFGIKGKVAFLDMLLNSTIDGKPLSDQDIREEVDTFMFEGQDTTSAAIGFAIYRLAKHPEIQQKVYDEMLRLFGNNKETHATFTDLQNMTYLEMVIKETLRLYPSVPGFGRTLSKDIQINDIILPAGYSYMLCPYAMHRNPDYFPDPYKFDPERFSQENIQNIRHFSYIPFSAGYRNCIGQKFAMLEMKSVISKLIRNFEFTLDPDFKEVISFEIIIRSSNGINVKVSNRL